ncbi:MAG: M48 family metallopeptidase [Beijerinckiaceae bacterium]
MEAAAAYFDGLKPIRQSARVMLGDKGVVLSVGGGPAFTWTYGSVRLDADDGPELRFHREESGARTGEALEIPRGAFADALRARCPSLTGTAQARQRTRRRIIGWSAAAVVSLAALIFYGVPALSSRLATLVPWRTEVAIGNAVEGQILREMSKGTPRVCGADKDTAGKRALAALVGKLTEHVALPGPIDVKVIDSNVQNAFALPGGKIVFMRGLIEKAEGPDEVAGVLAHEIGHVVNRDAMRGIIHAGGISFLIGTLLGDFTGAGALVIASRYLLTSRHSRSVETQADTFAIDMMTKAGGDIRALARFLQRVATTPGERQLELLLSHPVTADRVAEIERAAGQPPVRPIMTAAEWSALRAICRE